MKVLAQKHVERTLREMGKTGSKTSPKSFFKLAKQPPFIELQKLAVGAKTLAR